MYLTVITKIFRVPNDSTLSLFLEYRTRNYKLLFFVAIIQWVLTRIFPCVWVQNKSSKFQNGWKFGRRLSVKQISIGEGCQVSELGNFGKYVICKINFNRFFIFVNTHLLTNFIKRVVISTKRVIYLWRIEKFFIVNFVFCLLLFFLGNKYLIFKSRCCMMNEKGHIILSWTDFSTSVHINDHKIYHRTRLPIWRGLHHNWIGRLKSTLMSGIRRCDTVRRSTCQFDDVTVYLKNIWNTFCPTTITEREGVTMCDFTTTNFWFTNKATFRIYNNNIRTR